MDAIGQEIRTGNKVLYMNHKTRSFNIATVTSITEKTVMIQKDGVHHSECGSSFRQKKNQIVVKGDLK